MKKTWMAVAALLLIVSALVVLVLQSRPSDDLVIGAMMPLSGDNAVFGTALQRGMKVALGEINRGEGVGGQPLAILFEDTQAKPELGVTAFQKLVSVHDCKLVLGGMFSAVTLAVAPLAERAQVVLLSPTSSAIELTEAGDYVFRIYPSDSFDGDYAATFAYDELGARTAGVLALQVASTEAVAEVFVEKFRQLDGDVVFQEFHREREPDFRLQLRRLAETTPDIVFLPSYQNEMARILRQHDELGLSLRFLGISTFNDPAILELAGPASEGVIFSTPLFNAAAEDALTQNFVAAYSSEYGEAPNIWAGYGYDAVRVAAHALRGLGRKPRSEAIRDALYSTRDFPGVTGAVTFDRFGDVRKELQMMQVSGGVFTAYASQP